MRLPASQLQKALRRGFCSPAPLLEACSALLRGGGGGGGDGGGGGGGGGGYGARGSSGERGEGWRRVWEHRPEATPFGADGWARRELPEMSKVLLGCTDEPWLAARRSKAVLFSRGASLLLTGGVRDEVARWLG